MFTLGLLIGIYAYSIFILGVLDLIQKNTLFVVSIIFIISVVFLIFRGIKEINTKSLQIDLYSKFLIFLLLILAVVNLIGVLGPEIAFDALWYHLTIPKIFIQNHSIFYIDGGLFYYSLMPKLIDLLYIPSILFINETSAKFTHFLFGIGTSVVIYSLSRRIFNIKMSLLAVLVFYSNLVVGWQSTTAYIDLGRTFYEVLALYGFIIWFETKNIRWLLISALMLGLAISTKLLSFGSIFIFVILIGYIYWVKKEKIVFLIKISVIYFLITLFVVLPWFLFSYLSTGNPVYPVFNEVYKVNINSSVIKDLIELFTKASDPISPIYLIFLPFVFILYKRFNLKLKIIAIYSLLAILVWIVTPNTGGGRFIMPYLPAFSVLVVGVVVSISSIKLKKYLIVIIVFVAFTSIIYRGIANFKYLPVVIGSESKSEFLSKNLNFRFGEFYDTDEWFGNNIHNSDVVLLIGFHNLFYVDFPFIHNSYLKKDDYFNYIAAQGVEVPIEYKSWHLIYENLQTNVKVYKSPIK